MLNVSDLAASYGMHEALHSVSLHVSTDEIVVILGANGAGKSTLLKAIAGICEGRTSGAISLDGSSISGLDAAEIVERGIAFVPEGRGIFGDLSVHENLLLGAYADHARVRQQENLHRVLSLFPKLAERQKQIARTMSGGEQQMVAIGRALMSAPSILMLDEPSLGLSPLLCKELFSSLKQVRETGVGILLVEQNAKQSLGIADRGYLLENGNIIGEDSASKLLHDPAVQAAYLGGAVSKGAAAIPLVAKPSASVVSGTAPSPVTTTFIQRPTPVSHSTAGAESLAGEDIDALVARASSSAMQSRRPVISVNIKGAGLLEEVAGADSGITQSSRLGSVLPSSQDTKVQQLLADFEQAAVNASSGSNSRKPSRSSSSVPDDRDDVNNLPHIPVFRKSSVTVYRRDHAGKLRKQERS